MPGPFGSGSCWPCSGGSSLSPLCLAPDRSQPAHTFGSASQSRAACARSTASATLPSNCGACSEPRGPSGEVKPLMEVTRRSEEHTSELQSLMRISYAVFCTKKKKLNNNDDITHATTERLN